MRQSPIKRDGANVTRGGGWYTYSNQRVDVKTGETITRRNAFKDMKNSRENTQCHAM